MDWEFPYVAYDDDVEYYECHSHASWMIMRLLGHSGKSDLQVGGLEFDFPCLYVEIQALTVT